MILFTILLLTLAMLIVFGVIIVSTIGAAGIIVFGDIIVCIVFIVLLIRFISKRKRRR